MSNYYVIRLATQFKVMFMDPQSAAEWVIAGWELRKYNSQHEAQFAIAEWEANSKKRTLFIVRRRA
jgi:hypothetical protein